MKPDENGVYRWRYAVNLYKNPGILWLFYKVFGGIFAGCMLFALFLADFEVSFTGVKWALIGFAVLIAILTLSYYIYALIQGGRYTWDFVMDEEGVAAKQVPNEAKRNKVLGVAVAAMGVATGNLSQIGVGTMVATDDGRYSRFATVTKVKPDRKHNTINIRNGLFHNQVFASGEDFDFVMEYITAHSPKLKKS
ncbi:MAG: hypothetical protein J6Z49_05860 [Kiritimatiellae bacterium]|nr:hypothetical protein [Kiritimatiellia bacterium]